MLSVFITPWTKPTRIQCADHACGPFADLREPFRVAAPRFASCARKLGKVARDAEIDQPTQHVDFSARRRQLEVPEAQERRRDPADDGARLLARMAVVEHVAHHRVAGRDQAQRTRGRHAEMVHRLAAQEFADRRAQHGAAIGGARVGRRSGALELQFPALSGRVDQFAQRDGASVAELSGPMAELVPAVVRRDRLHAGEKRVAAEDLREFGRCHVRVAESEPLRHFARIRDQPRVRHRLGRDAGPQRRMHLADPRSRFRIAGKVTDERVVESGLHGDVRILRRRRLDECIRVSPHGVEHGNARDVWATRSFIWR